MALSSAYCRRQAELCLRLSLFSSDQDAVLRLLALARSHRAMAEALDAEPLHGERKRSRASPAGDEHAPHQAGGF
jgi:hypothetical protein